MVPDLSGAPGAESGRSLRDDNLLLAERCEDSPAFWAVFERYSPSLYALERVAQAAREMLYQDTGYHVDDPQTQSIILHSWEGAVADAWERLPAPMRARLASGSRGIAAAPDESEPPLIPQGSFTATARPGALPSPHDGAAEAMTEARLEELATVIERGADPPVETSTVVLFAGDEARVVRWWKQAAIDALAEVRRLRAHEAEHERCIEDLHEEFARSTKQLLDERDALRSQLSAQPTAQDASPNPMGVSVGERLTGEASPQAVGLASEPHGDGPGDDDRPRGEMGKRQEILGKIDAAMEHVFRLCDGRAKWRMSVPVRDDDSDTLLTAALTAAREWMLHAGPSACGSTRSHEDPAKASNS